MTSYLSIWEIEVLDGVSFEYHHRGFSERAKRQGTLLSGLSPTTSRVVQWRMRQQESDPGSTSTTAIIITISEIQETGTDMLKQKLNQVKRGAQGNIVHTVGVTRDRKCKFPRAKSFFEDIDNLKHISFERKASVNLDQEFYQT